MGTASEGSDDQSERCGSYSLSADISELESSSSFSCRRFDGEGASSTMASSPRAVTGGGVYFPAPAMLPLIGAKDVVVWDAKLEKRQAHLSHVDMMKERFAKLLLGEDMSGGGRGVCTALAISNAITNLSATVFGELWRLEPLAPQKKAMWRREMEWLSCVSDSIVELVPSIQQFPGGGTYEVMEARSRSDLYMNLPALKKLDAMLIGKLDGFSDTEFWYVDGGVIVGEDGHDSYPSSGSNGRPSVRQEDKWWLPCPKVPLNGLSEDSRKKLQQCRDCTNQILKAALAINSSVLAEIETPNAYLETLPKSGKECMGDIIYQYMTSDQILPEHLLDCFDLSSEHQTLEIANRIEAAVHVWTQKNRRKLKKHTKAKHSSWSARARSLINDTEKNSFLSQRAETLLQSLRHRFPGLPQTTLDMNKIQYNKDVGQSILESYSRVMESLAFNIIARIDDVLFVDDATKRCGATEPLSLFSIGSRSSRSVQKHMSPSSFSTQHSSNASALSTPALTPISRSPKRATPPQHCKISNNGLKDGPPDWKTDKPLSCELERLWS